MRKFECNDCEAVCELTIQMDEFRPTYCLYNKEDVNWYEVKEDTTQVTTPAEDLKNYIQLPDWVKVGAIGYDESDVRYYEVTAIHDGYIDILYLDDNGTTGGINNSNAWNSKQAHKRPFNEKEMKALVGKVAEDKDGNAFLVIEFIKEFDEEVEGFDCGVQISNSYYGKHELMKYYTIDGKPCYVLEHLENGEWVE